MRTFFGLTAIALALAACGSRGPGNTPRETFEAAKSAAKSNDFGAVFDLMAPAQRKRSETAFQAQKQLLGKLSTPEAKEMAKCNSAREYFAMEAKKDPGREEFVNSTFDGVKIEGDSAAIQYMHGGMKDVMKMVRVNGKWYLDMQTP